jgi:cobalt-zinc-cadmium resistance protein CzcA
VTSVRTISLTGLSDVKVQFTYDVTYPQASQTVIQPAVSAQAAAQRRAALHLADQPDRRDLPLPRRQPAGYSVTDLKTIQDWILLRRLKSVPGVIDVTTWGGRARPSTSPSISTSSWPTASRSSRCSMR